MLKIAFDDFSNPENLAPDWVAECEMEQYKVRLRGHQCALTSVRFEVTNKQLIFIQPVCGRLRPAFYGRAPAAESRSGLTRTFRELMGVIGPTALES